jgi:hypothetical protein
MRKRLHTSGDFEPTKICKASRSAGPSSTLESQKRCCHTCSDLTANNSRCTATRRLRTDVRRLREKPGFIACITRDGSPFSGC